MGLVNAPESLSLNLLSSGLNNLPVALPFVTVVVTLYNYETFVLDCLRSIAGQSYPRFKCVVIDDCSTDRSAALVEDFLAEVEPSTPFVLVRHAQNQGQMAAFKTGLQHAEGEFLVYVDADDLLLPDFLQGHLVAHLSGLPVAFTSSDQYQINEHGEIIGGLHPDLLARGKTRRVYPHHVFGNRWVWATTSSMMFRRAALELIVTDTTAPFRTCADNYLCHFANMIGGSLLLPQRLGCYRRHGNNHFSQNRMVGGAHPTGDMRHHPSHHSVRTAIISHLILYPDRFVSTLGKWPYARLLSRAMTFAEAVSYSFQTLVGNRRELLRRSLPVFLLRSLLTRARWNLRWIVKAPRYIKSVPPPETQL